MVVRTFCTSGELEGFKGSFHGMACAIAAAMAAYNIAAWYFRREAHLGANAIVYSLAVGWEVKQTLRHVEHLQELQRCRLVRIPIPPVDTAATAA